MSQMSTAAILYGDAIRDILEGERAKQWAVQHRADVDSCVSYIAVLMDALHGLEPGHAALRPDLRACYLNHGERISKAERGSFNPWDYTSHRLYQPPHELMAELDGKAKQQRAALLQNLQASLVKPSRRLRWYWLFLWGPRGVKFLDGWWPQAKADQVRAWREELMAAVRAQRNAPAPCPSLAQLVRQHPAP